ncbi:dipeptidase [Salirhabdus salicampi]|uniref:dipeptidase n=1 Tax=Salirhabdus salicampi TaxID=476102 RepID=UPI0020C54CB1|nr:dipeptidase [Salirhabdus salicampi]MCP8616448.1 dipeptidase [Salirhabdus salicampi]
MIIDAHCDVLYQLWKNPSLHFKDSPELRVNYHKWMKSDVKVQCFAIFVPDDVPDDLQFRVTLDMVNLFYENIIAPYENIKLVKTKSDIQQLQEHEKGAMLTLEGCHPIGQDVVKLKTLLHLGVRSVGLTWNNSNATCDGIGEERGAGLTSFGYDVVETLNTYGVWADVSHISYQGFWDVLDVAEYPVATHSNAYDLMPHKRNLDDKQIKALIDANGFIGMTFVPEFLTTDNRAHVKHVVQHMEKILELGGEDVIGLGSDFDGTSGVVKGIKDHEEYNSFVKQLEKTFSKTTVHKLTFQNFLNTLP